jgi:hypothetical protein
MSPQAQKLTPEDELERLETASRHVKIQISTAPTEEVRRRAVPKYKKIQRLSIGKRVELIKREKGNR